MIIVKGKFNNEHKGYSSHLYSLDLRKEFYHIVQKQASFDTVAKYPVDAFYAYKEQD
jgi:hypothetical protein